MVKVAYCISASLLFLPKIQRPQSPAAAAKVQTRPTGWPWPGARLSFVHPFRSAPSTAGYKRLVFRIWLIEIRQQANSFHHLFNSHFFKISSRLGKKLFLIYFCLSYFTRWEADREKFCIGDQRWASYFQKVTSVDLVHNGLN